MHSNLGDAAPFPAWPDMQGPVRVTPHGVHGLEPFCGVGGDTFDLSSVADLNQQWGQLHYAAGKDTSLGQLGTSGDRPERSLSPRRVDGMWTQPQQREEIRQAHAALLQGSVDLKKARDELQALRTVHQQKVLFWECGAQHLLCQAEQFLGAPQLTWSPQGGKEELESGRFGREATKFSLTVSPQTEGNDVVSLRRLLKDALKNKEGKEKSSRKAAPGAAEPQQKPAEAPQGQEPAEGDRLSGDAAAGGSSRGSREASPAGDGTSRRNLARNGACADTKNAEATHFVMQFTHELRQLLAMSQQSMPGPAAQLLPGKCVSPSQESSPRSVGGSPPAPSAEQRKLRQCLESIPPVRQGIAQNIMAVEKMLRGLDQDLKRQCEELFGLAEPPEAPGGEAEAAGEGAAGGSAEAEARKLVPLGEEHQLLVLAGLRSAQQRLSAALAEFVRLPLKLKTVFDLTKTLGSEVNSLVPVSALQQAEAQASAARQQHAFHVEMLQRRLQELSAQGGAPGGGGGDPSLAGKPGHGFGEAFAAGGIGEGGGGCGGSY